MQMVDIVSLPFPGANNKADTPLYQFIAFFELTALRRAWFQTGPRPELYSLTTLNKMVPGGGIEPPTRGFSIRCSTPELPGQAKQGSGLLAPLPALVQCRKRFFADQL